MDIVSPADFLRHLCGDDALHRTGMIRHGLRTVTCLDDVIQQQNSHLVAGDGDILLPLPHQDTDTVRVGIGADDEVAAHFSGKLHRQRKPFRIFRIGTFHRGERAVDDHLFLHGIKVPDPKAPQRFRDEFVSASVERRIYHFETVCHRLNGFPVDGLSKNTLEKGFVRLLIQQEDLSLFHRLIVIAGGKIIEQVDLLHLFGDLFRFLRRKLRPVGPVDLVSVVFLRIVAGGHVDARCRTVITDGK